MEKETVGPEGPEVPERFGREPSGPPLKGIEKDGWRVSEEEVDRVIRKLEEGWSF